jgi:hypothetical protein
MRAKVTGKVFSAQMNSFDLLLRHVLLEGYYPSAIKNHRRSGSRPDPASPINEEQQIKDLAMS